MLFMHFSLLTKSINVPKPHMEGPEERPSPAHTLTLFNTLELVRGLIGESREIGGLFVFPEALFSSPRFHFLPRSVSAGSSRG